MLNGNKLGPGIQPWGMPNFKFTKKILATNPLNVNTASLEEKRDLKQGGPLIFSAFSICFIKKGNKRLQTYGVHATHLDVWSLWCWQVNFLVGLMKSSDTWLGYIFELFLAKRKWWRQRSKSQCKLLSHLWCYEICNIYMIAKLRIYFTASLSFNLLRWPY